MTYNRWRLIINIDEIRINRPKAGEGVGGRGHTRSHSFSVIHYSFQLVYLAYLRLIICDLQSRTLSLLRTLKIHICEHQMGVIEC